MPAPKTPQLLSAALTLAVAAGLAGCGTSAPSPAAAPSATPAAAASSAAPDAEQTVAARTTAAPWDRPDDQDATVRQAGLSLTAEETLAVHYHTHLDVIVDGQHVPVPAGLGINATADGSLPAHGSPGIAPLHTHTPDGVLHIEAPKADTFTLGQVFTLWGVALDQGSVGSYSVKTGQDVSVWVNGQQYRQDPRQIVLRPHEEIAVIVEKPGSQTKVPTTYAFPAGE